MEWLDRIAVDIKEAQSVVEALAGADDKTAMVLWLERQLLHLIASFQGLVADIEAGFSITDLGFACGADFEDMLEDMEAQIRNLRGLLQSLRCVAR